MPERETRLPCPACLGVMMDKLKPVKDRALVLDACRRCGGIWFDAGEVGALRQVRPRGLERLVSLRDTAYRMPCHSCHGAMDRNAPACPSCGWRNVLDCPACQKPLHRVERDRLVLDVCRACRGVWFDNHELAEIWNMEVRRHLPATRREDGSLAVADYFLLDAFLWAPDLVFLSGHALGHGAGAVAGGVADLAGGGLGGAAEAAGGALEAVGDAAGSIFEVIAEVIGGLFS